MVTAAATVACILLVLIPIQGLVWLGMRRENQTYRRLLRMQLESAKWRIRK